VRPIPVWRLQLARGLAFAVAAFLFMTLAFASDDSYTMFATAFDLRPLASVSTTRDQVALMVNASDQDAPALAREMSTLHLRGSFLLDRWTPRSVAPALIAAGDQPLPALRAGGGPVRWLGTRAQLDRTAARLGLSGHIFYAVPKGFTMGQYLLGHIGGATAVAPSTHFDRSGATPDLERGAIIEVTPGKSVAGREALLRSLAADLRDNGLRAIPVGELAG
jgi:hypothetical protein